jgi:hypothetical protein
LSNCLWMYCAFLGIARPWNNTVSVAFVLETGVWAFVASFGAIVLVLALAAQGRLTLKPR